MAREEGAARQRGKEKEREGHTDKGKPLREKARCSRGVGILTAWKVDRQARLGGQVGRCSGGTYVVRDLYGSLSRNNACVCIWRGGRGGGGPGGPR